MEEIASRFRASAAHGVEADARDLLTDLATAHTEAAFCVQPPEKHRAVVEIVQRILAGKNGVRH